MMRTATKAARVTWCIRTFGCALTLCLCACDPINDIFGKESDAGGATMGPAASAGAGAAARGGAPAPAVTPPAAIQPQAGAMAPPPPEPPDTRPESISPSAFSSLTECFGRTDGPYCEASVSFVCGDGEVQARAPCSLGCRDAVSCEPLLVGGTPAESAAAVTAAQNCDDFVDDGCGSCLNRSCCAEAAACFEQAGCRELMACVSGCTSAECEQSCALRNPSWTEHVLAIVRCAQRECADACEAEDPCVHFGPGHGYGCGANLSPSVPEDRLYLCRDGATMGSVICAQGCFAAPPDQRDHCNDQDPCANSPYDGPACGSNLSPLAIQDGLYNCFEQRTQGPLVLCASGCNAAPPGEPDGCF